MNVNSALWKSLGVAAAFLVVLGVAGFAIGEALARDARYKSSDVHCGAEPVAADEPTAQIAITGQPATIPVAFGYGRGRRHVAGSTFSAHFVPTATAEGEDSPASPPSNAELPERINLAMLPLAKSNARTLEGVSAHAVRVGTTQTYQLHICIDGTSAAAGTYQSSLLFQNERISADSTPLVEVTFQNRLVPYVFGFIPVFAVLGIFYTSLVMIRRKSTGLDQTGWISGFKGAYFSANGIIALILSIGAAFGAWRATCYGNSTWGSDWPDVLIVLAAIVGAAAGAATPSLTFADSKDEG